MPTFAKTCLAKNIILKIHNFENYESLKNATILNKI